MNAERQKLEAFSQILNVEVFFTFVKKKPFLQRTKKIYGMLGLNKATCILNCLFDVGCSIN